MTVVTESGAIQGVYLVQTAVHHDERGYLTETYRRSWVPGGLEMVQSNHAERQAGCVVGLHYHLHQADYWYVISGHARVVLHDLRRGSPTDGATVAIDVGEIDGKIHNHLGIYIPPGVAHGFSSISDVTLTYLVDGYYDPADELGIAWDDPTVDADWALTDPMLSERDRSNPTRYQIEPAWMPHAGLRR